MCEMENYIAVGLFLSRDQSCVGASWHSPGCALAYPRGWCVFAWQGIPLFTSWRWYPQILYRRKSFAPSPLYVASLIIVTILRIDNHELYDFSVIYFDRDPRRSDGPLFYPRVATGTNAPSWMCTYKLLRHQDASEESSPGRDSLVVGTRCKMWKTGINF